jgi:hypothetical protein
VTKIRSRRTIDCFTGTQRRILGDHSLFCIRSVNKPQVSTT